MVLVVDAANVVGSVPDGWWRDRAGAAERLLTGLVELTGRAVPGPDGTEIELVTVTAVLEGAARSAAGGDDHAGLTVVRAPGSGDDAILESVVGLCAGSAGAAPVPPERVLVVTADRGLRDRLPAGVATTGPGWLNRLVGRT